VCGGRGALWWWCPMLVLTLSTGAAAAASDQYNLLPLPSSNQISPTVPRSPSEGLSFSLNVSLFSLDCTLHVCVQCDRRIDETSSHKD
jgi:hypothetical protein